MKSPSLKRNRKPKRVARTISSVSPIIDLVRRTCKGFIELRRAKAFIGNNELIGGLASMGGLSVLVLILGEMEPEGINHSSPRAQPVQSGYRKAQYLMQLAHKFNLPVIVFTASWMSSPGMNDTEPHEAATFTRHLVSQQHFESPMILVLLNRWNSGEIFGVWFAHKVLAFEQARFLMTIMDQGNHCHVQVGTKVLLRYGIIDGVVPEMSDGVHPSYSTISRQLRSALRPMVYELSQLSPEDLRNSRREKIARVSAFSSKERGWGDKLV